MKRILLAASLCALALAATSAQQTSAVKTISARGSYIVNATLNLRDAPDLASGKVIGQVAKGSRVEVIEMSYLMYPIQGMRAAWFRLNEPEGWVYGYYLDPTTDTVAPTPRPEL